VGQAPFLLVAALAALAMARRLGIGRASAVIAAAWFASSAPLLLFAFEPNVDTLFIAGYLLAAYFFLRYALGDDDRPALALGALAAGGALGSKAVGVVFVPPLLALAVLAVLRRARPVRDKAVSIALIMLLPLVMAGYWYGRNALLTGNPLYPLHVEAFGRVWLAGWYGPEVMRLSQYYLPARDLRALGDIVLVALDPRLAPVWLAALAGAWNLGRAVPGPRRAFWGCSALAIVNVGLYWVLIPYRTQQRFMLHALGLAAVPLAATFRLGRWVRWCAVALLALHLLTPQAWPFDEAGRVPPWDLSPLIPSAVRPMIPAVESAERLGSPGLHPTLRRQALATLGLGAAALATAWAFLRVAEAGRRYRWARASVVAAASAAVAAAAVWPNDNDPRRLFFPVFPDYYTGWIELDLRSGPQGARVAYAGTNLPYYLLGVGLRNEVRYVNVDRHRGWLLHDYHREARANGSPTWPQPRPGWDRIHPDYDAWLANLRAERIQILVVARANPTEGPHNIADGQGFPIERVWADAHPETFEPLYGVAENDPLLRIYRVRPATR
jgi:hypothetical protein